MSGRLFFVGGNWKCNGNTQSIKELMDGLNSSDLLSSSDVEIVVAPPSLYLQTVKDMSSERIYVASQNCWLEDKGAFTGEISPLMLKDLGIQWTILGHSERRSINKETNDEVGKKVGAALKHGLSVILCVGENAQEREEGRTNQIVEDQLKACKPYINNYENVVIAYEPVWAIGTGKVATPQQAQEVHKHIRNWLSSNASPEQAETTRIIYGGSVKPDNCDELAKLPDVDGFLVGGASLVANQFIPIIHSCKQK